MNTLPHNDKADPGTIERVRTYLREGGCTITDRPVLSSYNLMILAEEHHMARTGQVVFNVHEAVLTACAEAGLTGEPADHGIWRLNLLPPKVSRPQERSSP